MTAISEIFDQGRLSGDDPTPLYLRLQSMIQDAVTEGLLKPQQALPAEREIATTLGVSRVTVRKAISGLVDDGILTQKRGSGTFVSKPPHHVEQRLSRLTSFSEDMVARGLTPSFVWLERTTGHPTTEEVMVFGLSTGEKVTRLHRLRLADGVPMAIELAAVPARLLPNPAVVERSLYKVLDAANLLPTRALQRFSAVNLEQLDAERLGVEPGTAALRIERISYLEDGSVVEFTRSFYRSDAYDFVAELAMTTGSEGSVS